MSPVSLKPWYREPWPWLLMSGPAAVLVAGAVTAWLAVASADGLVAEDYYKQGLAVNRVLAREEAARRQGLAAEVFLQKGKLTVKLSGEKPDVLFAHLAHTTRAGFDLRVRLARSAAGDYEAELPPLPAGRWHVVIEDARATWRIAKEAS
jgi:uncharacterized protein